MYIYTSKSSELLFLYDNKKCVIRYEQFKYSSFSRDRVNTERTYVCIFNKIKNKSCTIYKICCGNYYPFDYRVIRHDHLHVLNVSIVYCRKHHQVREMQLFCFYQGR